jgi:hypothetical protein
MSYFPTPFGHLSDWRIDPRNPKPQARTRLQAEMVARREHRR